MIKKKFENMNKSIHNIITKCPTYLEKLAACTFNALEPTVVAVTLSLYS